MGAQITVSVIIVSFNQFTLLAAALASVFREQVPFAVEVIVVDNGSDEDVEAYLQPLFPFVAIIKNRKNLGFGRANNIGAKRACGAYLLFLNSDAELLPGTLPEMVRKMEAESAIGVLGPLTLNSDNTFQLSFGRPISIWGEFRQKVIDPRMVACRIGDPLRPDIERDVGWVSGACLMTRRSLFPDGTVFDENMFLYFEDHELCLRVKAMNLRVVFWSRAVVRHRGVGSKAPVLSRAAVENRKSQLYLYRKQGKSIQLRILKKYLKWKYGRLKKKCSPAGIDYGIIQEILNLVM